MVGTSKILTVSYGTFSCTLEGFDDSFGTMKAIAEYFRGLAADDRYFGAEPPTPDAEMLAQIAEREISRRVDASMGDDGVHLRAAALTDQSANADEAAKAAHDKGSRAEVEAARKAAKATRKAAKAQAKADAKEAKKAKDAARTEAKAKADAVEAKAAEQAAQVAANAPAKADAGPQAEAEAEPAVDADSQAGQTATQENVEQSTETDTDDFAKSISAARVVTAEETPGSKAKDARDDVASSVLAVDNSDIASKSAPKTHAKPETTSESRPVRPANPDSESVAAKLQRIRAVVGNSDKAKTAKSDDLISQFLPEMETPDVADFEAGDYPVAGSDTLEAELDPKMDAKDDTAGGTDMISRVMARHNAPADADIAATAPTAETPIADDAAETNKPRARIIRMKRADFEKAKAEGAAKKEVTKDVPPSKSGPDLGRLDGADELDDYLEDSDFADDVAFEGDSRFSDDLAALQSNFKNDPVETAQTEDDAEPEIQADEEDKANTVGAVAAAMSANASNAEPEPMDDAGADPIRATQAGENITAETAPQVDDAALDRLLSETNAQMQEPEGSRRRDAIAQLKAAVAAKEAARQVGEFDDDGQDVENAFRNDLSEVTDTENKPRPRPVVRSEKRTERPRPAPLKLVAAQRVDLEQAEKRDGPVVPRRVGTRAPEKAAKSAGSFAQFAKDMGASNLPELLEAAAAYTSFVEGAGEFSRPQILRRARAAASDDFNREDGLRSFADLLRSGRFTKVRNGRFQVADDSRYNPERRAG